VVATRPDWRDDYDRIAVVVSATLVTAAAIAVAVQRLGG
jgi:hypothetical protein